MKHLLLTLVLMGFVVLPGCICIPEGPCGYDDCYCSDCQPPTVTYCFDHADCPSGMYCASDGICTSGTKPCCSHTSRSNRCAWGQSGVIEGKSVPERRAAATAPSSYR